MSAMKAISEPTHHAFHWVWPAPDHHILQANAIGCKRRFCKANNSEPDMNRRGIVGTMPSLNRSLVT